MKQLFHGALVVLLILAFSTFLFAQNDRQGAKDYPGVTRMTGYYIDRYEESQFDSVTFATVQAGKPKQQAVEGRVFHIYYYLKNGVPETSALQVVRNYQNAVKAVGGQVLRDASFDSGVRHESTMRFTKGDKEVWLGIEARSDNHVLTIVEKQGMKQEVAIDAAALKRDISANGKVAVYGIYFDTGKSDLKPESDATLAEIAKMLKQSTTLRVFVVGHTDMVGDAAANLNLSQARAQSVVTALTTKHAIAATRLIAFGNGPYSPVDNNKTEEGRAKNRRVELVEIATN